jgi:predicted aspartyl protease
MTRYRYNQQVSPPAPFVYVAMTDPAERSRVEDVAAQVDCAADITVIPSRVVEQLQLARLDMTMAMGFDGRLTEVPSYLVRIAIRGFPESTVKVLASRDEPFVLLGRDVLNRHRIVLDGPGLVLEVT